MKKMFEDMESIAELIGRTQQTSIDLFVSSNQRKVAHTDFSEVVYSDLPLHGHGADQALNIFEESILPMLSDSAGSRYLGFVTGGTTPAALIADWLVSVFDQNTMISGDSIAVDVERHTITLLKQLFNLDHEDLNGVLTTGATASNIIAMAVAREWAGNKLGIDFSDEGVDAKKIRIYSAAPHSSIRKALSVVGVGRKNLINIPVIPGSESIDTLALEKQVSENLGMINIVVANAGTVNTGSFDSIDDVACICKKYDAWLHVDAAFGIFTRLSPEMRFLTSGIEKADSITVDVHKWLNVPYDCGLFLSKHSDLQQQVFRNNAPYLKSTSNKIEPMDVGIENSRRFRALPVWFSLMSYGKDTFRKLVEFHCELAIELAKRLESSGIFIVLERPILNIICFAPLVDGKNTQSEFTKLFLGTVNKKGEAFFTLTEINKVNYIRAAFSNWRTSLDDLDVIVDTLTETYNSLIKN